MAKTFWFFTKCDNKIITSTLLLSAAAPGCSLGFFLASEWQQVLMVILVPHIVYCYASWIWDRCCWAISVFSNVCLNDRFVIFVSVYEHDYSYEQVSLSFLVPGGAKLQRGPEVLLCSLSVVAEHVVLLFMSLILGSFYGFGELAPLWEHSIPPTCSLGACKSNRHCWTLLMLACALWCGWKGCSWGALLVFNTKDDLATMMVVSCSLLNSAACLACVWYWRETPAPLADWGQWVGRAGDSSSLPVLSFPEKVKKSTSECNFYLVLCYYSLKCHGLAGDGEGMCPPGWLLALGGKDGYDG